MSCDIEAASPARPLHRVARRPDAWAWPDWAYAGPDGTFGNRYDDPRGEYRVLYASSDRLGAFVEVLARFRPEPAVLRALDEIQLEPGAHDDGPAPGQLPRSWLAGRVVGTALADGSFAAVGAARSLGYLRDRLADRALHHRVDELGAAAILTHAPRAFTQEVSRLVFECTEASGEPQFDGIAYRYASATSSRTGRSSSRPPVSHGCTTRKASRSTRTTSTWPPRSTCSESSSSSPSRDQRSRAHSRASPDRDLANPDEMAAFRVPVMARDERALDGRCARPDPARSPDAAQAPCHPRSGAHAL
jgi:hypothetical protein